MRNKWKDHYFLCFPVVMPTKDKSNTVIRSAIIFAIAVTACNQDPTVSKTANTPADTAKSFKLEEYWVTPKESFGLYSVRKSSEDTLVLVTCSEYVYYPFGKLTDKSSVMSGLLKDFAVTSYKRDTFTNARTNPPFFEWNEFIVLELGGNKLNLFLDNDPEASKHGYIRSGQIVDKRINLSGNIKIGLGVEEFFKSFFDYFPPGLSMKYKVVLFTSCVAGVTHIYTFDKGLLHSVKFVSL